MTKEKFDLVHELKESLFDKCDKVCWDFIYDHSTNLEEITEEYLLDILMSDDTFEQIAYKFEEMKKYTLSDIICLNFDIIEDARDNNELEWEYFLNSLTDGDFETCFKTMLSLIYDDCVKDVLDMSTGRKPLDIYSSSVGTLDYLSDINEIKRAQRESDNKKKESRTSRHQKRLKY